MWWGEGRERSEAHLHESGLAWAGALELCRAPSLDPQAVGERLAGAAVVDIPACFPRCVMLRKPCHARVRRATCCVQAERQVCTHAGVQPTTNETSRSAVPCELPSCGGATPEALYI